MEVIRQLINQARVKWDNYCDIITYNKIETIHE